MSEKQFTDIDLQKAWAKMAEEKFSNSKIKKQDIMNAIKQESHTTIHKLKVGLKYKMYWTLAFIIGLTILMAYYYTNSDLLILFGSATAIYVFGFLGLFRNYMKMDDGFHSSDHILSTMKKNKELITGALRGEKIWGYFFLPLSIVYGILFGKISKGLSIVEALQEPRTLMIIIVLIVVMTPLLYLLTNKMNQSAYGKNIKSLEENIIRMETLK